MKNIYDLSKTQLEQYLLQIGEQKFRATQIYHGLVNGKKISEMSNISNSLKTKLLQDFYDSAVSIEQKICSKDGTIKYLFRLCDGNIVEGVFMQYKYGNTQCISTQVGCRMGCKFCASTLNGLIRNLTVGELLFTVAIVNRDNGGNSENRKVTNVVLMGSGEPFDNYQNVVGFLRQLSQPDNLNVSMRNVSLSTCGLVDKMYDFTNENLPLNLTISLHSAFDEKRKTMMPIANKYSIEQIIKACKHYFNVTKRRFIFEYSLVKGVNDGKEDAERLIFLLKGLPCHINLIRLNEVKESNLKKTTDKFAYSFCETLNKGGLSATVRRLLGQDIEGACGQLRNKYIENNKEN